MAKVIVPSDSFFDAPTNDGIYARKNGQWTEITPIANIVNTISERDALTPKKGDLVKILSNKESYFYDGTEWVIISVDFTSDIQDLTNAVATKDANIIEEVQLEGVSLPVVDKSVNIVIDKTLPLKSVSNNYTLLLEDAGSVIIFDSSSNLTLTVPNNTSANYPIGTEIAVVRNGNGDVTIVPASGVTLSSEGNKTKIKEVYNSIVVLKTGTNN
jgi:hypothetical protein